jgi:hypothetical protein
MSDPFMTELRDEYAALPVPDYPAAAVASARLARGPRRRSGLLRLSLAGAGGLLAGALLALIPGPQHDRMLALLVHDQAAQTAAVAAPRTVTLDEARRLATFPVVVPAGVPVDSVRIGGDNATVQLIVRPRRDDRVLMVERPADAPDEQASTSWKSGSTSVTVIGPPDGSVLRRLRQATGAP